MMCCHLIFWHMDVGQVSIPLDADLFDLLLQYIHFGANIARKIFICLYVSLCLLVKIKMTELKCICHRAYRKTTKCTHIREIDSTFLLNGDDKSILRGTCIFRTNFRQNRPLRKNICFAGHISFVILEFICSNKVIAGICRENVCERSVTCDKSIVFDMAVIKITKNLLRSIQFFIRPAALLHLQYSMPRIT